MKKLLFISAVLALSLFAGCLRSSSSSLFKERVGNEIYAILSQPKHVKVEGQRSLTEPEIQALQKFLLEDKGYIFDRTKKCLFIPEVTLTFETKEKVVVMVSLVCKQVKYVSKDKTITLDTDPMSDELKNYIHKELIK
jgi:hypothetical protein